MEIPIFPAAIRGAIGSLVNGFELKSLFAILATVSSYLLGADLSLVIVLVTFIGMDYVTGVWAAFENGTLSAREGLRGIVKKVLLFSLPVMANVLDQQLGISSSKLALREVVLWMLIANECLSILENLIEARVIVEERIPPQFRAMLIHLAKQADEGPRRSDD